MVKIPGEPLEDPKLERQALELVVSAQESGKGLKLFGVQKDVRRRAKFIRAQFREKRKVSAESAILGRDTAIKASIKRQEMDSGTVFVDGQGFSVAPQFQQEFIQQQKTLRPSRVEQPSLQPPTEPETPTETTPTFFEQAETVVTEGRERFRGTPLTVAGGVTAGLVSTGVETARFGVSLATQPKVTALATSEGIKEIVRDPRAFLGEEVAQFKQDPAFFVGEVLGEVLLFKGTGKGIKVARRGLETTRAVGSPKFKGVKQRALPDLKRTEEFIEVPEIGGAGEIGLIPAGLEKKAPTLKPTVRGGFGFTKKEQEAFLKKPGPIVSAQADFPEEFLGGKPLEKEFFGTPPLEERGFVRVSRLGLEEREASLKDILKLDVSFKRAKPQIIVFPEEVVGRKGGFQPQLQGTELEVILGEGKAIRKTGEPAVTLIGGRRVKVTTAEIFEPSKQLQNILAKEKPFTRSDIKLIQKETGFEPSLFRPTKPVFPTGKLSVGSFLSFGVPTTKTTRLTGDLTGLTGLGKSVGISTGFATPELVGGFTGGISPPPSLGLGVLGLPPPSRPPIRTPTFEPPLKPPRIVTDFPELGIPEKRARKKGKRKLKRTPSLISIQLGFEAPKISFGEETGLIARPVLRKKRKKKKGGKR